MGTHGGTAVRRAVSLAAATTLAAASLSVVAVTAAQAAVNVGLWPAKWAYTDSRNPDLSFVDQRVDHPVGAWRDTDGKLHKSRSYFTFDLTQVRGTTIISGWTVFEEEEVNDCSKARNWELWRTTEVVNTTSWSNAPQELEKLADIGGTVCPSNFIGLNLAQVVQQALDRGDRKLTLEVRVPADGEGSLHYGRKIDYLARMSVRGNTDPFVPSNLVVDNKACEPDRTLQLRTATPFLNARFTDPDTEGGIESQPITGTFAVWPVDNPVERLEWTSYQYYAPASISFLLPAGFVQQDRVYAWSARTTDELASSDWAPECRFTVDSVRPNRPPVVTSLEYPNDGQPHGGPGIPGTFTFSANGIGDVAGYKFRLSPWDPEQFVAADALGGSASVSLTPRLDGFQELSVYSVDKVGNRSDTTAYRYYVRNTAVIIEDANPDAWPGDAHLLTFRPRMEDVVSYTYQLNDGPEQTVTAGGDGVAQVSFLPGPEGGILTVRSTTSTGLRSYPNFLTITVTSQPVITSAEFRFDEQPSVPVGKPGTFTFAPHMHGVVEYVYQFNRGLADEQPSHTVAAGADGKAGVPFTTARFGGHSLHVVSRTADGTVSQETEVWFYPLSIAPTVVSPDYPEYWEAGGPGVTGHFTFTPATDNVVEYLYQFGDEPEQRVAAAADGTATIEWTPRRGQWYQLIVRSRSQSGLISNPRYYGVNVAPQIPGVESPAIWDEARAGEPVTFTLTANLVGSTEFVYQIEGEPEHVIAVGPDGTAQFTWTAPAEGFYGLSVYSRTANGYTSGLWGSAFYVNG
ncbi:MAG TPA: hypothetical protein VFC19_52715 [Candidatus Limnocylindrales bacterium]|nr:hypothetical protein [Candidatus Limnocylindrales bacterium]